MRKGLFVGINEYLPEVGALGGCVNDANAMAAILKTHGDGRPNFDPRIVTSADGDAVTKRTIEHEIRKLFSGTAEIALFYFAGHGAFDDNIEEGILLPQDYDPRQHSEGVRVSDLLLWAYQAKGIQNKIIMLDCCQAGAAGNLRELRGGESVLADGTTILTACRHDQNATEQNGQGLFTSLISEALAGAGANILGHITPGNVYSFVDQALGAWEQRPVFKTNVSRFVTLREISPRVPLETLRRLAEWFPNSSDVFPLDPSFEPDSGVPIDDHVKIFRQLQTCNRYGLIEPAVEEHMYYAAMNSTGCRLTALGAYYRTLAANGRF